MHALNSRVTGCSYSVLAMCFNYHFREHYVTAEKIKTFLDLEAKKIFLPQLDEYPDDDDSSSGDSFEQIEHSDIVNEHQTETGCDTDTAQTLHSQVS